MERPTTLTLDTNALKALYLAEKEARIQAEDWFNHPDRLLRPLSQIADTVITQILEAMRLPPGCTLFAVGGYGRSELYPESDVDLLLIIPNTSETISTWLSTFHNALWDSGLHPSVAARTLAECVELAYQDITIQTAQLEARFLAGDLGVKESFVNQNKQHLDAAEFFAHKRKEMRQRHAKYHHSVYTLEPNCKESPGGLRDLQVIRWMAKAAGFGDDWKTISQKGLITEQEAHKLTQAHRRIKRLRIALHLTHKRRDDRLLFEAQAPVASVLGIKGTEEVRAAELLMKEYYWAAHITYQLSKIIIHNLEHILCPPQEYESIPLSDFFFNHQQHLHLQPIESYTRYPELILQTFCVLQEHEELVGLTASTIRALWHAQRLVTPQYAQKKAHQQLFLSLFRNGKKLAKILEQMCNMGILGRYLPSFHHTVGQLQQDHFHIYTVDQHTFKVLEYLENLERTHTPGPLSIPFICHQILQQPANAWKIRLAALFHDCAKGLKGDHSVVGAQIIQEFAILHDLHPSEQADLRFLVAEHLTFSLTAQKKDLSDPHTIEEFAQKMENIERLDCLLALTVADIMGTNPNLWNSWKESLLQTLYHKTHDYLLRQENATTLLPPARIQEVAHLLAQENSHIAEQHIAHWYLQQGATYLDKFEVAEISHHIRELSCLDPSTLPYIQLAPLPSTGVFQLLVYTRAHAYHLHIICNLLAHHHIDILSAKTHQSLHHDSLFHLIVDPATHRQALQALIEPMRAYLSTPERFTSYATPFPTWSRRTKAFPMRPHIEILPQPHANIWLLTIITLNRIGILSDISQTLYEKNILLHSAKVMTLGERVEDTFYIECAQLGHAEYRAALIDALSGLLEPR